MKNQKPSRPIVLLVSGMLGACMTSLLAADYDIDPAHSFVEFRISHLGFSWLQGRFNKLAGSFGYDPANVAGSAIEVKIDPASVDTNHAERDKDLRSENFLDVSKFPEAVFKSTKYEGGDEKGVLEGELTLHGVTKPVKIDVQKVGEGTDPWGGYRAGFSGRTTVALKDYGITYDLGSAAERVYLDLTIEGIKKQ